MHTVELSEVTKRYGAVDALLPTSLSIDAGEFVVIVGPSGCGKSTILRLIAGLDEPTSGSIRINGRDMAGVPPAERGVAMVFQSYALYPHLTVRRNIAFPLTVARRPQAEIDAAVAQVAAMFDLTALLDRRPAALSGGQRQRVSIARAIVRQPSIMLLDEPLSNLDTELRVRMRHEFARLHARLNSTMIYVTHDQVEAMTLANRIVVMADGKVQQVGRPLDIYERPANLFVARAIGAPAMNLLAATVDEQRRPVLRNGAALPLNAAAQPGSAVTVGVRPEHLQPREAGPLGGPVELFERLGPLSFVHLGTDASDEAPLVAQLPADRMVTLGDGLRFTIDPAQVHLFAPDGRRLERA